MSEEPEIVETDKEIVQQETPDPHAAQLEELNKQAREHLAANEWEVALDVYRQALALTREAGDQEGEATTLNNIGSAYNGLGDWAQSMATYEEALAIREAQGDLEGQAKTIRNLAIIYAQHGNRAKAKTYLNRAMQLAKKAKSRELVGILRTTISQLPRFKR